MTSAQDHLAVLAKQAQDALASAVRTWAETVQRLSKSAGLAVPGLGGPDLSGPDLSGTGPSGMGWGGAGLGGAGLGLPAVGVPDLTAAVDHAFDVTEQVLAAQRELTKAMLRAVTAQVDGPGPAG